MLIKQSILKVLKYFAVFAYQPTSEEIYSFLEHKISRSSFEKELKKLPKYTPPQYSIERVKSSELRIKNSKKKLENWRFKAYIKLISLFPQIKLVGLSGSISMMNAREDDDIDLFIITAKNRLFTGRIIALLLAQLIGLRRSRVARSQNFFAPVGTLPAGSGESQVAKNFHSSLQLNNETMKQFNNDVRNKICLNLFFDERNLKVPKFKQTEFVGHEVLQMKPVIVKGDVYERFLESNKWVQRIFPNSFNVIPAKAGIQTKSTGSPTRSGMTSHLIESILKKIQLWLINRHRTTEIITSSQLWFHPDDFEKKLNKISQSS